VQRLARKELIEPGGAAFAGEDAFSFSHVLIRDAAYSGLLKESRAELHERFSAWLERKVGARVTEYEEIVGYHLEQAYRYHEALGPVDEHGRRLAVGAAERLGAAGSRAHARGDLPAAVNLLERAVSLLPADAPARLEYMIKLGPALFFVGDLPRADAILSETLEGATACADRRFEAHARFERSLSLVFTTPEGRSDDFRRAAEQAIAVFAQLADDTGLGKAWYALGAHHIMAAHHQLARESMERALEHARRARDQQKETEILSLLALALTTVLHSSRKLSGAWSRSSGPRRKLPAAARTKYS
jgi:predicted ATPase